MADQPLEPGQVVDGFTLHERLHTGGMAVLWRVTHPAQPGPLIMKVPRLKTIDDPAAIIGFEVEQMILPTLSGSHVPKFIADGDFTAQPYIVMQHIEGDSLRPLLDSAPHTADRIAPLMAKVALALHDLHQQHVVHLDIKPSNIMLTPEGEVVLVDFGLARSDFLPDLLAEQLRVPMGTGPYIAPEQVMRVRNDPRSDLFALGVMMYHLATGKRPFGFPKSVRGLRKRLWRDPVPPKAIRKDIPPWLQEIILRCLEVRPDRRYASAAQLAQDLQNPQTVALTERAARAHADSSLVVLRRWLRAQNLASLVSQSQAVSRQLAAAPIVMAAVDLSHEWEDLAEALRAVTRQVIAIAPEARLSCVTVLKTHRIATDSHLDEEGRNVHVQKLVALKHWARPLFSGDRPSVSEERVTCHVLEGPDPAAALLDYAQTNKVDHIVIGSRGAGSIRRYLGSVSAAVAAQAPCSVTIVRIPEDGRPLLSERVATLQASPETEAA
ncbi:serine/threonine protein kinase [beta proteobacterium AAP99]|nr:serine/threonine protein kinase [beta proteobacterium AAP99]